MFVKLALNYSSDVIPVTSGLGMRPLVGAIQLLQLQLHQFPHPEPNQRSTQTRVSKRDKNQIKMREECPLHAYTQN